MTFLESLFAPPRTPILAIPPVPSDTVTYRSQRPERVFVRGLGHADVIGARWCNGDVAEVHIRLPYGEMFVPSAVVCEGDNVVVLAMVRAARSSRVVAIAGGAVR